MRKQIQTVAAVLGVVGGTTCVGTSALGAMVAEPAQVAARTLSVSGTGKATGTPDLATMDFAVIAQADTASAAMRKNANQMTKVRDALEALGVQQKDMQTGNFYLQPRYPRNSVSARDDRKIDGYTANNTLTVRLRSVDKVGTAIDRAVAAGANSLGGLRFGFQNTDDLLARARRAAVRDARATAELLVDEAGVKLGAVQSISTHSAGPQPLLEGRMMAVDASMASTPIEAGEGQISVQVNIVYGLE
ncbi:MAG: SIMPL domain-containing protein [Pseudomonadota bacterium]